MRSSGISLADGAALPHDARQWRPGALPVLLGRPYQDLVDGDPAGTGDDVGDGVRDVPGLELLDGCEPREGGLADLLPDVARQLGPHRPGLDHRNPQVP